MSQDLLQQAVEQTDILRAFAASAARSLRDFTRRLELILSQDHKKIAVRDEDFPSDFAAFCTALRKEIDGKMDYWQQARMDLRAQEVDADYSSELAVKSLSLRAKALSRSSDDFATAYDEFMRFYKKYTLAKLPVWLLTSCCDDVNNLTGKILFLARELTKRTEKKRGY